MDRKLFITVFVTIMATALGASIVLPLLPVYASDLGATGVELGIIFSSFAFARMLILPLVGSWADNKGRRRFMLWGLFLFVVLSIGYAMAHSVVALAMCRFFQGFAAAMVVPVARAYVGDMTPPGAEGRVMGHLNMAFFGGLALGPWMGGFLKDWYGLESAFYSMGALAFAGLVLCWFTLPKTVPTAEEAAKKKVSYLKLIKIPRMSAIFFFRAGSIMGLGMNWSFMPLYGHDVLGLSASRIGVLVSVIVVMTTLLQPLFGPMADRVNRNGMVTVGGVLASCGLFMVPFCHSFTQLFVLNLFMGTTFALYMPPLMAIAVDVGRESGYMNRVMSLLEMSFSVGMVFGPIIAGVIKELYGLQAVFRTGAAIGLITCGIFIVMSIKKQPVHKAA